MTYWEWGYNHKKAAWVAKKLNNHTWSEYLAGAASYVFAASAAAVGVFTAIFSGFPRLGMLGM